MVTNFRSPWIKNTSLSLSCNPPIEIDLATQVDHVRELIRAILHVTGYMTPSRGPYRIPFADGYGVTVGKPAENVIIWFVRPDGSRVSIHLNDWEIGRLALTLMAVMETVDSK